MKQAKIKKYWDCVGKEGKTTMPDFNFKDIELEAISKYLKLYKTTKSMVADVGCGYGFATAEFAKLTGKSKIIGYDYSKEMVERAQISHPGIKFEKKDIVILEPEHFNKFNIVITERCLINLPNWNQKRNALINIHHMLKDKGIFIMMECTQQGLDKLNIIRKSLGLYEDKVKSFNQFFDEPKTEEFLKEYFDIIQIERFGIYNLISKAVHPALVAPNEPEYSNKINEIARKLYGLVPEIDIGQNILYVMVKK